MMPPLFTIGTLEPNPWYSCRIIEQAMAATLSGMPSVEALTVDALLSAEQIEKIVRTGGTVLLLSTPALQACYLQLSKIPDITVWIPVFGDMTIETLLWKEVGQAFKGMRVVLGGASIRQCQQIRAFSQSACIKYLPYPVADEWFTPLPSKDSAPTRLVYAGRITPQKNVLELMEGFLKASKLRDDLELAIAGEFHERGYHLHGYDFNLNEFKAAFFGLVEESQGKITFHNFLSQDGLKDLYDRSDVFVSLSTYHDEDFGVSAAQASARGLELILTDWGGHWDYARELKAKLIPVDCSEKNIPRPSLNAFIKALLVHRPQRNCGKLARQSLARKWLGMEVYRKRIRALANLEAATYDGPSKLFLDYEEKTKTEYVFSYLQGDVAKVMYNDVYASYLRTVPIGFTDFNIETED